VKKRILTIAISLLIAVMTVTPALAWDNEDPCVVANEDFIAGGGLDGGTFENQSGAQPWPPGKIPSEGYNLYRDDVTDTGNLDVVYILTFTPDNVDLPIIANYGPYPGIDEYWYMGGEECPDTWYWALAPRGYNNPWGPSAPSWLPVLNQFSLWYSGIESYNWIDGNTLPAIDRTANGFWNGVPYTMRVIIPEGTEVYGGYCLRLVYGPDGLTLRPLDGGTMTFSNPVSISLLVDGEWAETSQTVF